MKTHHRPVRAIEFDCPPDVRNLPRVERTEATQTQNELRNCRVFYKLAAASCTEAGQSGPDDIIILDESNLPVEFVKTIRLHFVGGQEHIIAEVERFQSVRTSSMQPVAVQTDENNRPILIVEHMRVLALHNEDALEHFRYVPGEQTNGEASSGESGGNAGDGDAGADSDEEGSTE